MLYVLDIMRCIILQIKPVQKIFNWHERQYLQQVRRATLLNRTVSQKIPFRSSSTLGQLGTYEHLIPCRHTSPTKIINAQSQIPVVATSDFEGYGMLSFLEIEVERGSLSIRRKQIKKLPKK